MWVNVNRYRDYNLAHAHGKSEWSFVYYEKGSEQEWELVLVDPRVSKAK